MCLGIPGRILEINGETARVDVAGAVKEASLKLLEGAAAGDFVIIHAGFAIERVDPVKAEETLSMIREVMGR